MKKAVWLLIFKTFLFVNAFATDRYTDILEFQELQSYENLTEIEDIRVYCGGNYLVLRVGDHFFNVLMCTHTSSCPCFEHFNY